MAPIDKECEELFLVDSGITSMASVYLDIPHLKILNMHANHITRIENLRALKSLSHLDLSSNQITRMEGFNSLISLKHLNLSCNSISIVEGLTNLSNLLTINLSYNQITSLRGLKSLPSNSCLHTIQLQGNNLADMNHILSCLKSCQCLSCVVLDDDQYASNPVCSNINYKKIITSHIPLVRSMEKPCGDGESSDNTLITSNQEDSNVAVSTPHIDAVLEKFHQGLRKRPANDQIVSDTSHSSSDITTDVHVRDTEKKSLENQLAELEKELLRKRIQSAEIELQNVKVNMETTAVKKVSSPPRKASRDTDENNSEDSIVERKQTTQNPKRMNSNRGILKPNARRHKAAEVPSLNSDSLHREAVNTTYQKLTKDLDGERMRRSKAENAASLLAQQIKQLQSEASENQISMRNCEDAIRKLRKDLTESRETELNLKEGAEKLQNKCKDLEGELKKAKRTITAQETNIKDLEDLQDRLEKLRVETTSKHSNEIKGLEEALIEKASSIQAFQNINHKQKAELEEMRSLLASREADHRRDLEQRYTLDSPKLEALFQNKITSIIREHAAEIKEYESRLESSSKEYLELEDEFRMALQIEADRFQTLKSAFEEISVKHAAQENLIKVCKEKEEKATKMISDLTQLVKEQKDKILALSKEKQDLSKHQQSSKLKLEQQIQDLSSKVKDLERLKRDNIELKNQVQGQHSIISGLRKERELWSKELAQQGAALSSERGTLESKIETLVQENKTLRSNLDVEVDSVKIKTKLISDLTETVADLKKKLSTLEEDKLQQLKVMKDEHQKELENEKLHSGNLEHETESLTQRKEELKSRLADVEYELADVKESYKNLKQKWQEKSVSIEDQVKKMKNDWEEKERKSVEERDKAVQAASVALERLKAADDGFRKQLEAKESAHSTKIDQLVEQYELRVAEQQHKVELVEQEMRELLLEKEQSKRQFEKRIEKITQAFADLQQAL